MVLHFNTGQQYYQLSRVVGWPLLWCLDAIPNSMDQMLSPFFRVNRNLR